VWWAFWRNQHSRRNGCEIAGQDRFASISHGLRLVVLTRGPGLTIILCNKKRVEGKLAFLFFCRTSSFRPSFPPSIKSWEDMAMSSANICRRTFLTLLLGIAGLLTAASLGQAQSRKFTEWGWPQPYEKISDKSVDWLKQKGWWPLQVAFQSPWSGQNNINIVMDKEGLLAKRGIEMKLTAFGSGPAVNEVLVSGKVQVASAGNLNLA
jgi:hypothetical protein